MDTEHNLLLGILALRLGFLNADALAHALRDWRRDRSLTELLPLPPGDRALLHTLAKAQLSHHGGDPLRCLAALLPPGTIPPVLFRVEDGTVRDLVNRLERGGPSAPTQNDTILTRELSPPVDAGAPTIEAGQGESGRMPKPPGDGTGVRYRILRRHARGGLGEVFVAHDNELQREVALKEMQAHHLSKAESRQRFLLEGEVTGRLEHPGIVPVYGLGVYPDGRPFYVMRFIRGESLSTAIARFHGGVPVKPGERALELRKLLARFVEVCNAIAYAHSRGVLHRDLKPDNIMLGEYGETLVVDWGLAKVSKASGGRESPVPELSGTSRPPLASENSTESLMGLVIGTPQYMSPEQASGRVDLLGPASDVYSLGATLYTLLSGERPFPTDPDLLRILRLVQSGSFTPPRTVNAAVPAPLEAVCLKAMALKPEDRYDSPRDLGADVERWLADEPVSSYREPLSVRLRRWARRHRTAVVSAGVLCFTALIALAISYFLLTREQKRTEEAIHERALAQVDALLEANPSAVPDLLKGLKAVRAQVHSRLREVRHGPPTDTSSETALVHHRHRQTRASLALLAAGEDEVDFLRERLLALEVEPEECLLMCAALTPHRHLLVGELWAQVERKNVPAEKRFRALVALAQFDAANDRWEKAGELVIRPLLDADPLHVGIWTRALAPVNQHLRGPLSEVFSDPLLPTERRVAAIVLREYAAHQPELLVRLLMNANEGQFGLLLPRLQAHGAPVLPLVREALMLAGNPPTTDEDRNLKARQQANLALLLLLLGEPEHAWQLLRHSAAPDARTHLIHLFAGVEVEAKLLVERLKVEKDVSALRALVLALGSYGEEQLTPALRHQVTPRLLDWYRDHPDAGLHAAIRWLLHPSREGTVRRKLAWEQGEALDHIDAERRGQPPGRRRWLVSRQGLPLVLLGPVEFDMGSPNEEPGHDSDERQHRRRIDRTFALSAHEVTVDLYQQFLDETRPVLKSKDRAGHDQYSPESDCPVVNVTWLRAAQFCRWLSEKEGIAVGQMCFPSVAEMQDCFEKRKPIVLPTDYLRRTGYRPPTEAEWEYACRAEARTSRPHGVSTELLRHYAWDVREALARTWPVGQKKPNDFGLFDMHGNAAEWCLDIYADYPVAPEGKAVFDVETIKEVERDARMALRGAPFHPRPTPLRTAYRYWHKADDRFSTVGLRVARTYTLPGGGR